MSISTLFNIKTYAPAPVWSGSIANPVKFRPLAKKEAVRLWRLRAISLGVPAATILPPSSPAPGPMSMIQSLRDCAAIA